jgi:pantetheine-phosphate adenylyltransferase
MSKGLFGGTFDTLHDGHKALFLTAFEEGDEVIIGITSEDKANEARERDVEPYAERKARVTDFCKTLENIYNCSFTITKINDSYERAITSDADFIVLSPEPKTHTRAEQINTERENRGKNRLRVIEAPYVTDYDGRKISATRIRNNEINSHGETV